jgi:hypothetical protein
MMKTISILALLFASLATPVHAACLRVMTQQELAAAAIVIARVRVVETDDSDWGEFGQIATLEIVDIIEGDFTIKTVRVLAKSHVACADDQYRKKDEFIVFLEQSGGLYHTVNFQYGQFRIEGEVVRAWRNGDGATAEKPYYSVREEVESLIAGIRNPKPEAGTEPAPAPQSSAQPTTPPLTAPKTPPAPPQRGANAKPERNIVPTTKSTKSAREVVPNE